MDEKYCFDLASLCKDENDFELKFTKAESLFSNLIEFKGKLKDKAVLLEYLRKHEEFEKVLSVLFIYAMLRNELDVEDVEAIKMNSRLSVFASKIGSGLAFQDVEIHAFSDDFLDELITAPAFCDYDNMFKFVKRHKKHVLSLPEEELLSKIDFSMQRSIFDALDTKEITFKSVKMPNGKSEKLDSIKYAILMDNKSQDVRRQAFCNLHEGYKKFNLSFAYNFVSQLKQDSFFAKVSKYKDSMDASMFNEEVEPIAYNNLISSVKKNLHLFSEYAQIRKRLMKESTISYYDFSFSLFSADFKPSYEEAMELVKKCTSVMGVEYQNALSHAFSNRWVDVFPKKGKTTGAFSANCSNGRSYVLMNYYPSYREVSVLAHEMGHAMHSYFSSKYQPTAKEDYELFVAEVASTVNEMLLDRYLLANTKDENLKRRLYESIASGFDKTVFRQTMFAEFEEKVHKRIDDGDIPTYADLNNTYLDLVKTYYGKNVEIPDVAQYEWSRVPHFYRGFYVYKYATGYLSAVIISDKLMNEKDYDKKYIKFLSSGSSKKPLELLKDLDVDLTKSQTFDKAFALLADVNSFFKGIK